MRASQQPGFRVPPASPSLVSPACPHPFTSLLVLALYFPVDTYGSKKDSSQLTVQGEIKIKTNERKKERVDSISHLIPSACW